MASPTVDELKATVIETLDALTELDENSLAYPIVLASYEAAVSSYSKAATVTEIMTARKVRQERRAAGEDVGEEEDFMIIIKRILSDLTKYIIERASAKRTLQLLSEEAL